MKLPEYLYVPSTDEMPGAGIIIHVPTLSVGQIFRFKNEIQFYEFKGVPVRDYMIHIVYRGDLRGRWKPLEIDPEDMANRMGEFYYKTEISRKPGFFKRFKCK